MEATGADGAGRLVFHLQEGQALIEIRKKLSEEESFEVATPNSTMAVRGTVFCVSVYINEAGETVTELSVFDGEVECNAANL